MIAVMLASVGEAQRGSKCLHQEIFFRDQSVFCVKVRFNTVLKNKHIHKQVYTDKHTVIEKKIMIYVGNYTLYHAIGEIKENMHDS